MCIRGRCYEFRTFIRLHNERSGGEVRFGGGKRGAEFSCVLFSLTLSNILDVFFILFFAVCIFRDVNYVRNMICVRRLWNE